MRQFTNLLLVVMLLSSAVLYSQRNSTGLTGNDLDQFKIELMNQPVTDVAPGTSPGNQVIPSDADYDLQFEFACGDATGEAGIETDGDYIYTTKWNGTGFFKYELDGTFLGAFQVGSVNAIRDLAYDGTYFYGGAAATTVYKMDFGTNTLIGQFTAPVAVRAIGYDEGENGFWANNWSTTITLFDEAGAVLNTIPTNGDESFYGFAYDPQGPYLWGYSQRTGSSQNILYKYALPSGTFLEEFDVFPVLSMPVSGDIAGGLAFHPDMVPGYWTILGIVQNVCIWGLEMGTTEQPADYDISLQSIVSPNSGYALGIESIVIKIYNLGNLAVSNIPYEVNWTGGLYSGSYSGIYEDTLNSKEYVDITLPVTVDFTLVDYSLLPTSPCIDAGDPDPAYYDPDGTIGDIGAFYYDQGSAAPVISDFTADPVSGRQPLVVQFSQEITGPVTSYLWSFSDGSTSTLPNPVKVFTEMGKVSVSLLVEGPGGQDILVKNDYITVLAPLPPLNPLFTATPLLGYAPLEVQFTNQSTGPWQTLLWDFGDGNTSTALNPLHTYQQPGEYTVTLSISTGTSSKMLVKENYIHAIEPMEVVAQFTTSGSYGAAPYTVAFFNGSFGSVDSLLWDFGDGNVSVVANPMNTYGLPGIYTATLTAFGPLNSHTAAEMILVESASPVITQITDRPNDQGGYVYVHFKKSFWDQVTPERSTESYTIQRLDNGNWVSLSSVLAYGEPIYTAEAATPADSSATSLSLTDFRVIAGMDEGTWISEPAQGYSVDNIVPASPMVVDYTLSEDQITITWQPSTAPDFQHFNVYRSQESGSYGNTPAASLTGLTFTDNVGSSEAWFYTITAVDDAGNESMPSEEVSTLLSMQITLPQGWSGISGFLDVYDPAVSGIFSTLLDDLVILVGENGIFWPGQNINTIGNWQTNEGYQVKMTQPQVLELRGTGPLSRLIQLSAGWNLIPVLSDYPVEVETLFAGKDLIIIKEVAGWNLYWPAKGINTLDMLQPGRSYFVMMGSAGQLEFPD